ncbi:Glycerol-3-phosphate dehydrogenase [NAD(P)+] [Eubacterium plexicaudatum ASF492]|nr:Glycerol-3-phosphate dehydrogenase [NAD(P)+] [Eubacterium plexicaudatum ASF492]
MAKLGVIGAGSWGTALAVVLEKNGHDVVIWSALEAEIRMLQEHHEHQEKLPGIRLADTIRYTVRMEEAVSGMDALVLAVPSMYTRQTAKNMARYVADGQLIISVAKGIEEDTLMTLSQIIKQEIPQAVPAVLCGPSHAEEVGRGMPSVLVAGAEKRETAERVQYYFMNEAFRVYTSPDVLGMEIGASLKM